MFESGFGDNSERYCAINCYLVTLFHDADRRLITGPEIPTFESVVLNIGKTLEL